MNNFPVPQLCMLRPQRPFFLCCSFSTLLLKEANFIAPIVYSVDQILTFLPQLLNCSCRSNSDVFAPQKPHFLLHLFLLKVSKLLLKKAYFILEILFNIIQLRIHMPTSYTSALPVDHILPRRETVDCLLQDLKFSIQQLRTLTIKFCIYHTPRHSPVDHILPRRETVDCLLQDSNFQYSNYVL